MPIHHYLIVMLLALTATVRAAEPSPKGLQEAFIADLTAHHGFKASELRALLAQAQVRQPILDAIARPAEKRLNWGEYRQIFLKPDRINGGVDYWRANAATLERAAREYGVPPQIIVAIVGVETRYGRHTGNYTVLDALYTLGFHYPKRGEFFRSELSHFLRLAREEQVDPTTPTGSYAGAMGKPQFISSSYRAYAVDFDGDGKRDIWNNDADVIGSVANYFSRHGWRNGEPVTQRLPELRGAQRDLLSDDYKPHIELARLRAAGLPLDDDLADTRKGAIIELENTDGIEYWLSLDNFYTITRYNHSPLYAMAVYQLSEEIRRAYTSTPLTPMSEG